MKTEKNKILDSLINQFNDIIEDEDDIAELTKDDVIDFLKDNPNPDEDAVKDWVDSMGFDTYNVGVVLYELATEYVKGLK